MRLAITDQTSHDPIVESLSSSRKARQKRASNISIVLIHTFPYRNLSQTASLRRPACMLVDSTASLCSDMFRSLQVISTSCERLSATDTLTADYWMFILEKCCRIQKKKI